MKTQLMSLALATAALAPGAALAMPTLTITPSALAAAVGASFTVDVVIAGLLSAPTNEIVSAFDLAVLYSGLLAQNGLATFTSESQLGGPMNALFDTMGTGPGVATGNAFSLETDDNALAALQSDSFTLFSLSFTGVSDGAALLNFGPSALFDRLVVGRNATALNLTYVGACVAIGQGTCPTTQVPEPASFGLAGLALVFAATAGGLGRRRPRSGALIHR